jgi:AraC-like DNA-binding protein
MGFVNTGTFDTRGVLKAERIDYWEACCSADLIGLKCSTTEEEGFQAKFDFYDFGSFTVYDISGEPHVICRSAETVRKYDKDSVFVTILMEGEAFVNRRQSFDVLKAGDLILYDTNTPYMHGFPRSARQVVFDVPGSEFRHRFPGWDLRDAVHIDGSTSSGTAIARSVRKTFSDVRARKYLTPEPELVNDIWSALELSHDLLFGGTELTSYHLGIMQRARGYVRARISDPSLNTEEVAQEIGMSSRQLNRILAAHGLTVKKLIMNERLGRARDILAYDKRGRANLSELAYSCGFSGPSQFSKSFRRHFGRAPSEMRDLNNARH